MSAYLQRNWNNLTKDLPTIKKSFYNELIDLYSSKNRFYHNLNHIEALLKLSEKYRHLLNNPKSIDFCIWYHDAIYNVSKTNNEEKSADVLKLHLTKFGIDSNTINYFYDLILATKTHTLTQKINSFDAKFLLDIDLSILAVEQKQYIEYTKQIRKEYKRYTNCIYNKGRLKILKYFLEMDNIYKTELFQKIWELKAKENINYEISLF